jgi:hypothetical protein
MNWRAKSAAVWGLVVVVVMNYLLTGGYGRGYQVLLVMMPLLVGWVSIYLMLMYGWGGERARTLFVLSGGWVMWVMGELVRFWLQRREGIEVFPSVAEAFFVTGYGLMALGLVMEIKLMRLKQGWVEVVVAKQWWIRVIGFLIVMGVMGYTTLGRGSYATEMRWEEGWAVFYAWADLVLVGLSFVVMRLVKENQGGRYGQAWWWLLLAYLMKELVDVTVMANPEVNLGGQLAMALKVVMLAVYASYLEAVWGYLEVVNRMRRRWWENLFRLLKRA